MLKDIQESIVAFNELMNDKAFASATNFKDARVSIEDWKRSYQFDDATGEAVLPDGKFSDFALHLVAMYKGETQGFIQQTFNQLFDLVQGSQAVDLFNKDSIDNTPRSLADAINEENDGAYHYVYDRSSVRQKRDPKEIGISSVRGGSIVGDHEVLFCGPDEVITLRHTAYSRSIFANGAVNAAVYLAKKEPGLYDMGDLIAAL